MLLLSSLLLALAAVTFAQDTDIQTIESSLKSAQVIPDVLPSNFTPRFPIEVAFTDPSTKQVIPVTAGMNLTTNQTTNIPNFAILSNNTQIIGKPYLIAIVDPDAPSPPNRNRSQVLQFLGINYISQNLTDNTLFILSNTSTPILSYKNPTPPNGSVPHRYVVAMYLQNSTTVNVTPGSVPTEANRTDFNLTTFAAETGNLTLLGATFFFVGPGNSTSTNSNSTSGNVTLSSILAGATNTAPAASASNSGSSTGSGGAINLDMVAPLLWSTLGTLFGAFVYFL